MLALVLKGVWWQDLWTNNRVALAMVSEWRHVVDTNDMPTCREYGIGPELAPYTAWVQHPRTARGWMNAGRIHWLQGDCEAARNAWARVLEAHPRDEDAALWLFWAQGGDVTRLPASLEGERLAQYATLQGEEARRSQAWEKALRWYELSLRLSPNRQTAARMAGIYLRQKERDKAAAVWEQLAAYLSPEAPDYWWARGQAAELREDWEQAAAAYEQGAAIADDPYPFLIQEGYALERLRRWSKAEAIYRRALKTAPDRLTAYLRLGHLARREQRYEDALMWYKRAQTVAPERLDPLYYIAITYFVMKEDAKARTSFQDVLARRPHHAPSLYYLAQIAHRQGKRDEAIALLSQAIEAHRGKPWTWAMLLGDWYRDEGDTERALAMYRQALQWGGGDKVRKRMEALLQGSP